jgi:hypothetical protein
MSTEPRSLPELPEADATREIARIYQQLRTFTAAPMTALIWRHLATHPGVLEAAWAELGPLYAAGVLQDAAWTTADGAIQAEAAPLPRTRLSAAGLDDATLAGFVRVLDAYNRVNPVNFAAVRILLHRVRQPAPSRTTDAASPQPLAAWTPPAAIGPLPPAVAIAAIPPEHRRLIDELSSADAVDRTQVVPTLYRHLTGWPGLIPLIHETLVPRFRSGEMRLLREAVADALDNQAETIARQQLASGTGKPFALPPEVVRTLEIFSSLIPEMVVVGTLLRRGIGQA